MMKLEVENAYGLRGRHVFSFKPGLNMILCSNAKGASSTVRALALLVGQTDLRGAIHRAADTATVKLHANGSEYFVYLKYASNLPAIKEANLLDQNALNCVIVNEKHPLHWRLDAQNVKEFITNAANLSKLTEDRDKAEKECVHKHPQLSKVEATVKGLKKIEAEYRRVTSRIQQLEEEYVRLRSQLPKKQPSEEQQHAQQRALEALQAQLMRCRQNIHQREAEILDKQRLLVKAEAELAYLEAAGDVSSIEKKIEQVDAEHKTLTHDKEKSSRLVTFASALRSLGRQEECPACAIFGIHSDWSKILEDTFVQTLENCWGRELKERARLQEQLDDHIRTLRNLRNLSRGASSDIGLKRSVCREVRGELNTLTERLKNAQRELATTNFEWKKLSREFGGAVAARSRVQDAKHELAFLREQAKQLEVSVEELRNARAAQQKLTDQLKAAQATFKEKTAELRTALNGARETFNKTAKALLLEVGLKGFKEVTVDESFEIKVVREGYTQSAMELSSSESATLTILMTLAAKRAYFLKVPFFAVDTITTSYNLSAQKRLISFLERELSDHVIVTLLAPKEQELKVMQSFPSSSPESTLKD